MEIPVPDDHLLNTDIFLNSIFITLQNSPEIEPQVEKVWNISTFFNISKSGR